MSAPLGGDRDDQAAALGELREQRRRRRRRGGVDGDRLERGSLGHAAAAVADQQLDVLDAERGERCGGRRAASAAWRSTLTTSAASSARTAAE